MTFPLCTTSCPNMNVNSLQLHSMAINGNQVRFKLCSSMRVASTVPLTSENSTIFLRERERVKELALRQQALLGQHKRERHPLNLTIAQFHGLPRSDLLAAAYDRCRELFLRERDPFGWAATSLMKPEKQKALWAIWAWGRRLDELVDGVNGSHATHDTLDRWKQRTVDTYQGRPWDIYDVALFDTVSNFPIDIQLFHDLTEGTRLDMMNKRFANFDKLYLYENYVNGTIFLLFFQMMGIDPESKSSLESVYHATSIFAAGFGLIDMLRDVGEDARLGRIFLPEDELLLAGIPDDDIFNGKVTDKWRAFMKGQIKRARGFLDEGKHVINELEVDVRWAIWTGLLLYMQLLDGIEANDYDNLTKKASLGKGKMLLTTLIGYGKSRGLF